MSDEELVKMIRCTCAVLAGAAYQLYDVAIAQAVANSILHPAAQGASATNLHARQRELPRIKAPISATWVEWASSTRDNWAWMMEHYRSLRAAHLNRFGQEPRWHAAATSLWMRGPRPRPAGRTPFPEEPC